MKKTLFFICLVFSVGVFSQEKRLALVIGNSAYEYGGELKNPVNDAYLMSSALQLLGFDVFLKTDATKIETDRAILDFWRKLDEYDVALLYYAGHGIQVNGVNYILPIDAQLEDELSLQIEAIDIGRVVSQFERFPNNTNIVILDACRDNPFRSWMRSSSYGFSAMRAPSGTLIAYATSEGATASDGTGRNGLYTENLTRQMLIPQRIEDVFINTRNQVSRASNGKQNPQEWSQLTGSFYFTNSQLNNTSDIYASGLPQLDYKLENKTTFLDEVKLVGEKQKFVSIIGQEKIVIDQRVVNMFPRVRDLIRMKGYNVVEGSGAIRIVSRRTLGAAPVIYLDGTRLRSESPARSGPMGNAWSGSLGFSFLYELYTADLERIEFNPRPNILEGPAGAGGVISMWSRRTPLQGSSANADKRKFIDTTYGFDVPKKFYTPKYIYASPLFELTGAIHWEPQLSIDSNGKSIFNIADTGIPNISFYIEGMSEDGNLISAIKTIYLADKSDP
jgi:hypothetical protein